MRGSISLGIHTHDLPAGAQAADLLEQAELATSVSFDGVTVSEHHAGFPTYLPNPLLVVAWMLERLERGWFAACPMLLSARSAAHVIEDIAWLAARHPGRVGVAFVPGYVEHDFAAPGHGFASRRDRHWHELPAVVAALRGEPPVALVGDRAVAACAQHPVSVLSTADGPRGAAHAAAAGCGVLVGAYQSPGYARVLFEAYLAAGGGGPRVLIRRVHVGRLSGEARRGLERLYTSAGSSGEHPAIVAADNPVAVADQVAREYAESGATALNLRVNVPGVTSSETRDQIRALGDALWLIRAT